MASGSSSAASDLREVGNQLYRQERYSEAAQHYRDALVHLASEEAAEAEDEDTASLQQALKLNLATCLLRIQGGSEGFREAIRLCDDVLASSPASAKALFRRGAAKLALVTEMALASKRPMALDARGDLLEAARLRPADRQLRAALEEATEQCRSLPSAGHGARLGGLYADKELRETSVLAPTVVCSSCCREGHHLCGKEAWKALRADWLGVSVEAVDNLEPSDFNVDGDLQQAIFESRRTEAPKEPAETSSISSEEREQLEDCIRSIDRPYLQPRRKVPLRWAVQCAEELWLASE